MMKTTKLVVLFVIIATLLTGCLKSEQPDIVYDYVTVVVNEGNFSERNGSVNYYNEAENRLNNNPLKTSIGATYQSVDITSNGYLWVVANNPDKIVAFDALSGAMTDVEVTTGLTTPRFTTFYGNYMFVSNWGNPQQIGEWEPGVPMYGYPDSYVAVYNMPGGRTPVRTLPCGYDAEGLLIYNNTLFVATKEGVKVFDLSLSTMPLVTTITSTQFTTGNAKHFVVDASGRVWVSFTYGGLLCFDPVTYAVKEQYPVPLDDFTGNIAINKDRTKIFSYATTYDAEWNFTGAAVYATDVATGTQTELFSGMYNFYSIGVNPFTGAIYTADTRYDANSVMMVLDEAGNKKAEVETGVGTSRYAFFMYEQ